MALVLADRVKETSGTTGTGDFSLAGATTGFQRFADTVGDGNTTYYAISLVGGGQFEVGRGTYIAATNSITRDEVFDSSNNGSLVSFTTGTKDVFVVYPSGRAVTVDGSTVNIPNSATVPVSGGGTGASSASSARTNLGLGTISTQDANNVNIDGGSITGITDLAIADGGTGASTESAARTNLGLEIGTDVQAFDANTAKLDAITANFTGTLQEGGQNVVTADEVGTIASQDSNNVSITGGSISGITDLDIADGGTGASSASAARSNLGLGSIATQDANSVNIDGGSIDGTSVGLTTPNTGDFTDFTASGTAEFTSTGAVKIPLGTQAQRPTPEAAMLRFNSDTALFEGYDGTEWSSVGGSTISNDTATATDVFPLFADATSGVATDVFTSNSNLLYTPSTGELKPKKINATNGIIVNSATITEDTTIVSGDNAMSTGPVEVASGVTVTVESGARYVVI
jgi:hypothetical protein